MKPKFLLSLLVFLLAGSFTFAAVFSGKISNAADNEIVVSGLHFKTTIPLSADGSFSQDLDLKHNGLYTFINGAHKWDVYLLKDASLELRFDENNIDQSIAYTGATAKESRYLYQKQKLYEGITQDGAKNYSLAETDFVDLIDKLVLSSQELLKNAGSQDTFFNKTEARTITYNAQSYYYNYKFLHSYYTKSNTSKAKICASRLFDRDTLKWTFEEFLYSPVFRSYENGRFVNSFRPKFKKNPSQAQEILTTELATVNNPVLREFFLKNVAANLTMYEDKDNYLIKAVIALTTDESLKKDLTAKVENIGKFTQGAPAPDFTLNDPNGNPVSLSDFKGKNLYIDFWATWCQPCVAEIPALKKLEEKFKGKNIVFLSISLDSEKDLEKWKHFIAKKELGGTQAIVENAWKSKVVSQYVVESIPRFILIDTDGNLVDTEAPRPSSGKVARAINRLENL